MKVVGTYYQVVDGQEVFSSVEAERDSYDEAKVQILAQLPKGARIANWRVPDQEVPARYAQGSTSRRRNL